MSNQSSLSEVFAHIQDPRQQGKVTHNLVEMLVVAVAAILCGADNCCEIETWGNDQLEWLRRFLPLENGIASHDTYSAVLAAIEPAEFSAAFISWAKHLIPTFQDNTVIAIDGKTSRRSKTKHSRPLHLVSAFASEAKLVIGQQCTAEKSNEKTAIPELLDKLFLKGCIVTIDAMGTQPNIAGKIVEKEADYVLAVKNNQRCLAESIADFFTDFERDKDNIPHSYSESVNKDHGRIELRRCYAFTQLAQLDKPQRWPKLTSFAVVETERHEEGNCHKERRAYISSLAADAELILNAVRQHWAIENNLHWCMDVSFGDDQMRLRSKHSANNLATLKQMCLNLIRSDKDKPKISIKSCRLRASGKERYREHLLGWA